MSRRFPRPAAVAVGVAVAVEVVVVLVGRPRGAGAQDAAPAPRTLAAGEAHTCAVVDGGRVVCWGDGRRGQLGRPGGERYTPPTEVAGLPPTRSIAATHERTCALAQDGTVRCWGRMRTTSRDVPISPPTVVPGLSEVASIALGRYLGCASSRAGRVLCWGDGEDGGLGDGVTGVRADARVVQSVPAATAVAAGPTHACAALAGGRVVCWGSNHFGQLGDGTGRDAAAPVEVRGVRDVVQLAAAFRHTCARTRAGRVTCWGTHQVDLARGVRSRNPLRALAGLMRRRVGTTWTMNGLSPATDLAVSDSASCALDARGAVRCWVSPRLLPPVAGILGARELALGERHACARLADGDVRCWGDNRSGQTGDGVVGALATRPVGVPALDDAVELQATLGRTCALRETGEVVCWWGARHHDTRAHGRGPGTLSWLRAGRPVWTSFASGSELCGRTSAGALECATVDGDVEPRRWPRRTVVRSGVQQVVSTWHATFVRTDRAVACLPSGETALRPVALPGTPLALAAGPDRVCARLSDGRVWCVHEGEHGERASGSACGAVARPADALQDARVLALGPQGAACALLPSGTVRCVGAPFGPSGRQELAGLGEVVALGVGRTHACALRAGGDVACWGADEVGQRGSGRAGPASAAWNVVVDLDDAVELALDEDSSCARRRGGSVVCWGGHDPAAHSSLGSITPAPVRVPLEASGTTRAIP